MWVPARHSGGDARSAFEEARRELTRHSLPVAPPLMLPRDEREMHVWFPISTDAAIAGLVQGAAFAKSGELQVHIAIGRPEPGVDGFRRTSDQAKRVKDILLLSPTSLSTVVTYDQLGPVALMTADVDALRRFVHRALGTLANQGEREKTLRDTLLTFLAHNRSYAANGPDHGAPPQFRAVSRPARTGAVRA